MRRLSLILFCQLFLWFLLLCVPSVALSSVDRLVASGVEHLNRQEYQQAIDVLLEAEPRLPESASISKLLGMGYLGLGHQHLQDRRYEEARIAFEQGLFYMEDDARLWFGDAVAAYHLGQYAEAETSVQNAIVIDDSQVVFYQLLGQIQYATGQFPQALDTLEYASTMEGGEAAAVLLEKVRREWAIEQEMEQDYQGVFEISYADNGQSDLADAILDVLNDAYREVGYDLDFYPEIQVPVLIYNRREFKQVTKSPDWAGAVYDGKIRIPLGGMTRMTSPLQALLYHEYAHVLVRYLGKGRVPTWLNEGFAEVAGRQFHDPPLERLQLAREQDALLSLETLEKSFAKMSSDQAALAYEQSYSLTYFLIDYFGAFWFKDLLLALGSGLPFEQAIEKVYADYGMDWAAIEAEWRRSL